MKKFLSTILLVSCSLMLSISPTSTCSAQTKLAGTGSFTTGTFPYFYTTTRTKTNAANDTMTFNMRRNWVTATGLNTINGALWTFDIDNVSGTTGGTISIQGNAEYNSGFTILNTTGGWYTITTLNISVAGDQVLSYWLAGNHYGDYRAIIADTGTQSTKVTGHIRLE